jgi:hypothetical protein
MKTNHDGTVTLNASDTWTSCLACGKRVTGDSIHTCSPQLKTLTDEEIEQVRVAIMGTAYWCADENMPEAYNAIKVCCAQVLGILVKAQEK